MVVDSNRREGTVPAVPALLLVDIGQRKDTPLNGILNLHEMYTFGPLTRWAAGSHSKENQI